MPEIADAFVVGGGPAGLGAALGLCRQNHSVVLFDSTSYRNNSSTGATDVRIHMMPTWDHRQPENFRSAAREELKRYERFQYIAVEVKSAQLSTMTHKDRLEFIVKVKLSDGSEMSARKLILATGVKDIFPKIEGYTALWTKRIFHCLFCHGYEDRNARSVGVLAVDECADVLIAARIARAAHQFADSVTIYTNGNVPLGSQIRNSMGKAGGWCKVDDRTITRLSLPQSTPAAPATVQLEFISDGTTTAMTEDFVVHKPATEQASTLPAQLGLEMTSEGDVKVKEPLFETSRLGVFAVGDCASPHKFFGYASTAGGFAAAGAAIQLQAGY